jgi:hypothetical protein
MTASLLLSNVADAIAGISVSGVTMKDRDQIAGSWISTPNVFYPNPDNWITDFSIRFDTVLQGENAPMTYIYTLNYRFLGVEVGDLATFPVAYSALVDKVVAIINALVAVPAPYSGKVQMIVNNPQLGPKDDPAGNQYFGADFALQIEEMQN